MAKAALAQWLERLQAAHPVEIELGLERVAAVWQRLAAEHGWPRSFGERPVVSVAGTNGKGSTVAAIEALALAHGLRVGCYTSPHLLRFNERIRLTGREVDDVRLVAALEQVERVRDGVALTFFEHTTLAALTIFAGAPLDLIVLEVGLGGRLDAVNIVDADVAVVTSIDLDHQSFLGDSRSAIAVEKLGIARAGRPLLIGEADHPDGFAAAVAATGAQPHWVGEEFSCSVDGQQWCYRDASIALGPLQRSALLPINLALGLAAYRQLQLAFVPAIASAALAGAAVVGRQQRLTWGGRQLLLDVAHNPAGCRQLAATLAARGQPAVAVASAFADKDFAAMVAPLRGLIGRWWVAPIAANPRAADAPMLAQLIYNGGSQADAVASLGEALRAAVAESPPESLIVVLGSFMVVAEILKEIGEQVA